MVALHRANAETGKIIVAFGIHAGHFGRLATNQRATRLLAAFGDAGDNRRGNGVVEFAGGIIIKKEQRLCALYDQVICAHCDKINADAFMATRFDGQFQLRADAIIRGDQKWVIEPCCLEVEKPSKSAKIGIRASAAGRFRQRRNRAHERVTGFNGNTGLGIGVRFGLLFFCVHLSPLARTGLEFHVYVA